MSIPLVQEHATATLNTKDMYKSLLAMVFKELVASKLVKKPLRGGDTHTIIVANDALGFQLECGR